MDPEARRRACVEFRAKLSRDTGVNLTAVTSEALVGATFEGTTLQSNPGRFYARLGDAIAIQTLALVVPNHEKVTWWCYREAAEIHTNPVGMHCLAGCLYFGQGVTPDPAQAAVWYQKAADLGDTPSKTMLGGLLLGGDARSGIPKDAARGFALLCEVAEQGHKLGGPLQLLVAKCYLTGKGVDMDDAHGVSLLRQVINQEEDVATANAKRTLAMYYLEGNGVEADTVQAALWCQRAADGGDAMALQMLPLIQTCTFCGTTPARKHCGRCRKVRYCSTVCQAGHWNRETDPHRSHCRRAVEASQQEAGGASTSVQ